MRFFPVLALLLGVALAASPAHAQFGGTEVTGLYTPGVDMPYFSFRAFQHGTSFSASSGVRSDIYQMSIENVDSGTSSAPVIGPSIMLNTNPSAPTPTILPTWIPGLAAYTDFRRNRYFPREVFNDMAAIWWGVGPGQYEIYAIVSWPAGVGQAHGTFYPAGSTLIRLDITITP